jgi:hypothetical protein
MSSDPTGRPSTAAHTGTAGEHDCSRGVSYVLGFVLVFSVLVAGTLALFSLGVEVFADVDREGVLATNEESVGVVHSEVSDLTASGAQRRAFALELVDTRLATGAEPLVLRIRSAELGVAVRYRTLPLEFRVADHETTFRYAFGHAYRLADGSYVGVDRPPVFEHAAGGTRLVVPTVEGSPGTTELALDGTHRREFTVEALDRESFTRTSTDAGAVSTASGTVTVGSVDHPEAWVEALERSGFSSVEVDGNTVVGEFDTRRLVVTQARLSVDTGGDGP